MIGTEISHYRVLELLGRGGMGEVYLAEDLNLQRQVALKVLPGGMAENPDRLERFQREARTLAALDHPSIVTIHSVEEAEGVHLLTMQLVKGRTLGELIPPGGLPLSRIFEIALPLSDALAAAHEAGVTHRDLKPANVMVTDEGKVKVLDFGLARLEAAAGNSPDESARTLTEEGQVFGTVPYMSPEQVSGQVVDQRSDIFSLGVVLYEMATGKRPFSGDTSAHLISSILRDQPESVTRFNAELPHHLGRIIHRCLEKEPRKRYQAALDVHNELEGLQKEVESGVLRTSSHAIAPAARPRRPGGWQIAVGGAVLVLAVGLLWFLGRGGEDTEPLGEPAAFQQMKLTELTTSGNALEAAISPDGRYVAHLERSSGLVSLHVLQVKTGSRVEIIPPARRDMWDPVFSPDGEFVYLVMTPEPSTPADLYRLPVLGGSPQRVLENVNQRISFSPDGDRFAFRRQVPETAAEELYVARADGTGARLLRSTNYPEYFFQDPSWSPLGDLIAMPVQRLSPENRVGIVGVDVTSGEMRSLTSEVWFNFQELAWYPDGSGLVMTGTKDGHFAPNQIWEVAYPEGTARRVTNDLNNYDGISVTADGRSLVTVLFETQVNLWTAGAGGESTQLTRGRERNGWFGVRVAPDGSLFYVSTAGQIWRLPSEDSAPRQWVQTEEVQVQPVVSPDGRYVVYTSDAAGTVNIWRRDLDGDHPFQLTHGTLDYMPTISPDGQWVVFASEEKLYRVPLEGGERVQISDRTVIGRPAVSPDGGSVAVRTRDPVSGRVVITLFPFEGGEPTAYVKTPVSIWEELAWSEDGDSLIFIEAETEVHNLWRTPLDGGAPEQLTHFDSDRIWAFDVLPDGGFVVARGTQSSDVVLLQDFR